MKKVIILVITILILLPIKLNAYYDVVNPNCNEEAKIKLRELNSNIIYDFEKYEELDNVYFKIKVSNINQDLIIIDELNNKTYVNNFEILKNLPGGEKTLKVYGNPNGDCKGYLVYTKIVKVPYFNKYSKHKLCLGKEDYYLCEENRNITISEEDFILKIEEYNSQLNKETLEPEKEKVEETITFFDKAINFVSDYYMSILIGIIVIATITIIVSYFIKRKKYNF